MADPLRTLDAETLLTSWRDADLIDAEEATEIAAHLAARRPGDEPPLYVKILSAVGTFFATAFFLGFLGVSRLIDFSSGEAMTIWGGIFLAVGVAFSFTLRMTPPGLGRDFYAQSSFTAMAIGKVLVVAGAMTLFGASTPWIATIALTAVTVLTYPVSGSSLDRLLSPYAVFASILFEILERGGGDRTGWALTGFFCLVTLITAALLLPGRIDHRLRPIGLAALAAMGTVVCILASGHDFALWAGRGAIDPRPIEAVLTLSLVGLIAWTAGRPRRLTGEGPLLAVVGVVALGFLGAPGIVFALGLLILGHAHHDRPLTVFGILALPAFLVLWYYGRDLTFLAKSAVLVASGAGLLAARGYMALRGLDRETV